MIRRFVNLVAENRKSGMYSLHRLEAAKHLFYPSATEAKAAAAATEANGGGLDASSMIRHLHQLPEKIMSFRPPPSNMFFRSHLEFFGLLGPGTSEGQIFCSDSKGHALLFDADSNANSMMPSLSSPKGSVPISFSIRRPDTIEEDLYLMSVCPGPNTCFEVLKFGLYDESSVYKNPLSPKYWHWKSLPPPPFVFDPDCMPDVISSHTVVGCGGRTICISLFAGGIGTYCFDTVKQEWFRAGDWSLPFEGRAEYLPELKLWLGFSRGSRHLCATLDLANILEVDDEGPKLLGTWMDLITPEEWMCKRAKLVNLGSGRFCVAKVFQILPSIGVPAHSSDPFLGSAAVGHEIMVLTGVELQIRGKDDKPGILTHKSISYLCDQYEIQWML